MKAPKLTPFYTDNSAVVEISRNTAPEKQRKHINIGTHHRLHHNKTKDLNLQHIPISINIADLHTKPLRSNRRSALTSLCNFVPQPHTVYNFVYHSDFNLLKSKVFQAFLDSAKIVRFDNFVPHEWGLDFFPPI